MMDPPGRVAVLGAAAGWTLQCLRVLRMPATTAEWWTPVIALVRTAESPQTVVYKSRRLFATEYVEITDVLDRLASTRVPGLPRVLAHRITHVGADRRLHLLMEFVDGISLAHRHAADWSNEPGFVGWLTSHPPQQRAGWVDRVATTVDHLHTLGLLCPDLKTEQLILRRAATIVLVDVDGFVLADGYSARMARWQSAALPDEPAPTIATDQRRLALVRHELLRCQHARQPAL